MMISTSDKVGRSVEEVRSIQEEFKDFFWLAKEPDRADENEDFLHLTSHETARAPGQGEGQGVGQGEGKTAGVASINDSSVHSSTWIVHRWRCPMCSRKPHPC